VRDAFFRALADLGVGLFEPFEAAAPGRYLNVGIAEQTLVGVAAGLAYAGKVPFAYSIAPFVTSRAHDQVRVDVAWAGANVKLVVSVRGAPVRTWVAAVERRFARLAGLPRRRLTRYPGSAASWQDHRFPGTSAFVVELPGGPPSRSRQRRWADAVLKLAAG